MLSFNDINVLGTIIDTTFGRHSSSAGGIAIKSKIVGENLVITYHEVFNLAKDRDKIQQVDPVRDRAKKAVKEHVAGVKSSFKKEAGRELKLKIVSEGAEIEAMGYNFLSPIRPTLFRYTETYTVA